MEAFPSAEFLSGEGLSNEQIRSMIAHWSAVLQGRETPVTKPSAELPDVMPFPGTPTIVPFTESPVDEPHSENSAVAPSVPFSAQLPCVPSHLHDWIQDYNQRMEVVLKEKIDALETPWRPQIPVSLSEEFQARLNCLIIDKDGRLLGRVDPSEPGVTTAWCAIENHAYPRMTLRVTTRQTPNMGADDTSFSAAVSTSWFHLFPDDVQRASAYDESHTRFDAARSQTNDPNIVKKLVVLPKNYVRK